MDVQKSSGKLVAVPFIHVRTPLYISGRLELQIGDPVTDRAINYCHRALQVAPLYLSLSLLALPVRWRVDRLLFGHWFELVNS